MRNKSLEKMLLFVLLLSIPALAANFWESKEYSKWSEQECMQLLKKSPWAYSIGFGNVGPAIIASNTLNQAEDGAKKVATPQAGPGLISGASYGERESTLFFEFRALTSRPVKAAVLQMQVLRNPALKEQVRQIINSKPTDQIIIQFEYRTEPAGSGTVHDIHSYFLHATLADFRTNTYLASDKIDLLPVKDYLSPNDKRPKPAFVFPRFNEKGEPYFTGQENSITMRSVFEPEVAGKKQKYDVFIKMNPKEMWFQKEFAFWIHPLEYSGSGKLVGDQDAVLIPVQPIKQLADLVPAGDPRLVLGATAEASMHWPGFVDGAIGGLLLAWLFNLFARPKGISIELPGKKGPEGISRLPKQFL